jgi:hypothetical protein
VLINPLPPNLGGIVIKRIGDTPNPSAEVPLFFRAFLNTTLIISYVCSLFNSSSLAISSLFSAISAIEFP